MLASRILDTAGEAVSFIQGTPVAGGNTGSTTAASATLTTTGDAFAPVSVGDKVYISGEAGSPFTVNAKPDNNTITLSANATATRASTAHWRVVKADGIGEAALKFGSPMLDDQSRFVVFYNDDTF